MAAFATEADVRLRFQLSDTTLVPSALVTSSIADAHIEVLRLLNPAFNVSPPEGAVVLGEVLLAGAHLFRSLASKDAFDQKQMAIGNQRIDAGRRFSALTVIADLAEKEAWCVLEAYLVDRPFQAPAAATDSIPLLGEE